MNKVRKFLVTGLGTGYLPLAPGSWASAAVCGIFLLVAWASADRALCVSGTMAAVALLASVTCVWLGKFAQAAFGKQDPRPCTADEWAGQAIALLLLPAGTCWRDRLIAAGAAFFLFRLADVIKPPPARSLEKLPHGWGILLDDVLAGVYANIACQLLLRLWLLK